MLDYTGEKYVNLPPGRAANLQYTNKFVKIKNLLANTRSVLPGGANVALCVRAQFRHNNNLLSTRAAVLCGQQQQQLSSPSAGTRPCSSAKSELKTQKEGHNVPDSSTDERDSLEDEKEQDESHGNSGVIAQREETSQ